MQVSQRVQGIKPSATLAVTGKAKEMRAAGQDVLSFAAGEPDFDTPEVIKQAAIAALREGQTKYVPVPGDLATREVIAGKLRDENGIQGCTADHVVISAGGKQSLYQVFQALMDPPAPGEAPWEVLLPVPGWVSYAPQTQLAGGRVVELVTDASGGFKITPKQLRDAITPRSRVLLLNSPSNPCGTMYSPDEIRALAKVVAESLSTAPELVIVSDEIYEKLVFGDDEFLSIGSIPEVAERTITVNGLSKAYSMTGWRAGYMGGSGAFALEVAKGCRKLQSQSTTCVSSFILPAIRVALTQCADDVERMRRAFAQRGEKMYGLWSGIEGVRCPKPTGAFYVFPDLSAYFGRTSAGGKRIDSAMDFAAALLEETLVACVPGEDFGSGGERCCRFSFACSEEQIEKGMERVIGFINALK